jgi:hypothetical protein
MSEDLKDYRKYLVEARQKAFDDFDKTVVTLSAGALGISITFLKDLLGPGTHSMSCMVAAWICWTVSVVSVLVSYFVSQIALEEAIAEIDAGDRPAKPGGRFATATKVLNAAAGIFFLAGLIMFIIFVSQNMEVLNVKSR